MVSKLKTPLLFILLSIFSYQLVAQTKADKVLQKINLLNKKSRIWFLGKSVNEIYLNSHLKKIDVDDCSIPLENIEFNYIYSGHWKSAEDGVSVKKYHGVHLSCISGNCISVDDGSVASGFTMFFKTKKDCYNFINLLNDLNINLE